MIACRLGPRKLQLGVEKTWYLLYHVICPIPYVGLLGKPMNVDLRIREALGGGGESMFNLYVWSKV